MPVCQQLVAKADTDHPCGKGKLGLTGNYTSRTDSFGIEGSYKIDKNSTAYLIYGVTDEKIAACGLETGFSFSGRSAVVDLIYAPPQDSAAAKFSLRRGLTKICGYFGFDQFSTSRLANPRMRYELDTKLSDSNSFKMVLDQTDKTAKMKFNRRLDEKNRIEAEYVYRNPARKFLTLTLKHAYSKNLTFAVGANYGDRKYKVEWDSKGKNGPWTLTTTFGFNTAPYRGDWILKRRFEI